MGRISTLGERILIALVRSGEWEIDARGRIWRIAERRGNRWTGGHRLIPCARRRVEKRLPQGYLQVRAMMDGRRIHVGAHRLVWHHFNGDIPVGYEINHDNGLKDDNRPSNLLCETPRKNSEHAHRSGLADQFGEKNPAAKLSDNSVAQIRLAYTKGGYTMQQLADRFGVTFQTISKIIRGGRRPKQGGPVVHDDQRHCVTARDE
jgi:DNA-binding XRE family transcriptional regulator